MKSVVHVVGTRPNFVKAAPLMRALATRDGVRQVLVHTGQHYDSSLSDLMFDQLDLPRADVNLAIGSGTHARQTGETMIALERLLVEEPPDLVVVYGDSNPALAGALVGAKLQIPLAHVEAGLRSFDRSMPEEINRLLTDRVCDLLFTHSSDADANLSAEGVPADQIHMVGNVMIDSLARALPAAEGLIPVRVGKVTLTGHALVTLHRPSNVDDARRLTAIMVVLSRLSERLPIVFPVHPRTRVALDRLQVAATRGLHLIDPIGYVETLALQRSARLVITDSGGVQEETTYLGVPCLTLRDGTERPVTVEVGTNCVVGVDPERLYAAAEQIVAGDAKRGAVPPLWDGHAGERIAAVIADFLGC